MMCDWHGRWLGGLLAACLVAVGVSIPQTSLAQDEGEPPSRSELSKDEAKSLQMLIRRAKNAYSAERYLQAAYVLENAFEIFPDPAFHFRIGISFKKGGNLEAAKEHFEKYLDKKPEGGKRDQVKKQIDEIETKLEERRKAAEKKEKALEKMRSQDGEKEEEEEEETDEEPKTVVKTKPHPSTPGLIAAGVGGGAALAAAGSGAMFFVNQQEFASRTTGEARQRPRSEVQPNYYRGLTNGWLAATYASGGLAVVGLGTAAALLIAKPFQKGGDDGGGEDGGSDDVGGEGEADEKGAAIMNVDVDPRRGGGMLRIEGRF